VADQGIDVNSTDILLRRCALASTGTILALLLLVGSAKGSKALTALLADADMTGGAAVHVHFSPGELTLPGAGHTGF